MSLDTAPRGSATGVWGATHYDYHHAAMNPRRTSVDRVVTSVAAIRLAVSRGGWVDSPTARRASYLLAAALTGAAVALFYRPVWSSYDDTVVWQQAYTTGPAVLGTRYSGYLIVLQRAISLLESPNPLLIGAIGSYLAVVVVALFLAWRVHPATLLALIVAPAYSVYGSLSNIQWILAVYLIGMLAATPATSWRGRLVDVVALVACGLTGPFAMLLLPLYAVRAIDRAWRWQLVAVAVAAGVQIVGLDLSVAARGLPPQHDLLVVMGVRDAAPIALIALTAVWLPLRRVAGALYVAVVIPVLGITSTLHTTTQLLNGDGQRYFYLPWVVAIAMVLMVAYANFVIRMKPAVGAAAPPAQTPTDTVP